MKSLSRNLVLGAILASSLTAPLAMADGACCDWKNKPYVRTPLTVAAILTLAGVSFKLADAALDRVSTLSKKLKQPKSAAGKDFQKEAITKVAYPALTIFGALLISRYVEAPVWNRLPKVVTNCCA